MPRHPALNDEQLGLLKTLWLEDVEPGEIAARLGIVLATVHKARARLGLPPRFNKYRRKDRDPTPEEIVERASECLARRPSHERRPGRVEIRQYHFDGQAFSAGSFS